MSRRIKFEIKDGYLPQIICDYRAGFRVGSTACYLCKYRDRKNEMFKDMYVYCDYERLKREEKVKEYWSEK